MYTNIWFKDMAHIRLYTHSQLHGTLWNRVVGSTKQEFAHDLPSRCIWTSHKTSWTWSSFTPRFLTLLGSEEMTEAPSLTDAECAVQWHCNFSATLFWMALFPVCGAGLERWQETSSDGLQLCSVVADASRGAAEGCFSGGRANS